MICHCADPDCRANGCRRMRQQSLTHDQPAFTPPPYVFPNVPVAPPYLRPLGCVCPVGAEHTCRGSMCPRRPHTPKRKPKIKKTDAT